MKKKELRKLYIEKRAALPASEKAKADDLMLIQFQQLNIHIPALIMTYAAFGAEFDPQLVTDYCYFKNPHQSLFYPVIDESSQTLMCVVTNDQTEFATNRFGIDEPLNALPMFPEEIDLLIVPLLAFDVKGNRVGYGKGYYDRFLKTCREDALKIGFSYFDPEPVIDDIKKYDVKLDYCITPFETYHFNP